jgi:hypothetical protein
LLCWPLSFQVPAYPKIWTPILAAAMLSCTHLHFISSCVLSLLYTFETPKSFQLRPWPQICTPILTAATLYCMHLHFISPMHLHFTACTCTCTCTLFEKPK